MNRFIVSPSARDELDAIWDHIGIEHSSPDAADRLVDKFFDIFTLLAAQPLIGERCHRFDHLVPGLRQFSVGNYVIYYIPEDIGIRIGHIAHGAMDQEQLFRRWLSSGSFD